MNKYIEEINKIDEEDIKNRFNISNKLINNEIKNKMINNHIKNELDSAKNNLNYYDEKLKQNEKEKKDIMKKYSHDIYNPSKYISNKNKINSYKYNPENNNNNNNLNIKQFDFEKKYFK